MIISPSFRKINAVCIFCQMFVNFGLTIRFPSPMIQPYLEFQRTSGQSDLARGIEGA